MNLGAIIGIACTVVVCLPLILLLIYLGVRTLWYILQWVGFVIGICWLAWGILFGVESATQVKEDIKVLLPSW